MTFGQVIAQKRKEAGLSQKELALKIRKEDGTPISPQYLNDIEHDRRNPPAGPLIEQFAKVLNAKPDYLYYLAGDLPADLKRPHADEDRVAEAYSAFRDRLKKGR